MIEVTGKYTTAKIMIDDIEPEAMAQIHAFINNESFTEPVSVMPDVHYGRGAVIGFTMPMGERIIPNIVGVDQDCGMFAVKLDKNALDGVHKDVFDSRLRASIPMSTNVRPKAAVDMYDKAFWEEVQKEAVLFAEKFNDRYNTKFRVPVFNHDWYNQMCHRVGVDTNYATCSIGTLGSGNHFIEIGVAEDGYIWVIVHSGSRNLGLKACYYWQGVAVEKRHQRLGLRVDKEAEIARIKATYPKREWNHHIKGINARNKRILASDHLEYLEGEDMFGYLLDSVFLYHYAHLSREIMSRIIRELLGVDDYRESVNTVHNYVNYRDFIIRKGAVASYKHVGMIIPFNMEDGTLICEGKSNPEWNYSAPHGAGRLFSRGDAKRKLKLDKAKADMKAKGIYSSVIPLDEVRSAYKPAEVIEQAIGPTATIVHRIRPLMNFKAGEEEK
jgi:RNA-splicing ligase RtcB